MIQEQKATTTQLISQCLYQRMGMGNAEPKIQQALDKLSNLGLISYSEKLGYKIQSSTGQEWQRERDDYGVTNQQISEIVSDKIKDLLGTVENPCYKGKSFRWTAFYSDGRQIQDKRLQKTTDLDTITIDFRYLAKTLERTDEIWIQQSAAENYKDRLIWIIGSLETLPDKVRELARSQNITERYRSRLQSISPDKQRLYFEEQSRCEELEKQTKNAIAERFISGEGINGKDRNKICQFFQESLNVELDRENDAIADAVFQQFRSRVIALQELEAKYNKLPNRPELPETLIQLRQALENCTRSRQVENTVLAVKKYLDVLRDGIQQLGIINAEMTEAKVEAVKQACEVKSHQVAQLKEIGRAAEVAEAIKTLEEHLSLERPWRDIESLQPHLQVICDRYREVRLELINQQEQEAQKIETNIKRRNGFDRLSEEKSSNVLNSVKKARCQTTDDALYPRLLELRDTTSLKQAEQEANEKLDRILAEETQIQVVTFDITTILINREIASPEEVEVLVTELRDRLLAQLKDDIRIRIT